VYWWHKCKPTGVPRQNTVGLQFCSVWGIKTRRKFCSCSATETVWGVGRRAGGPRRAVPCRDAGKLCEAEGWRLRAPAARVLNRYWSWKLPLTFFPRSCCTRLEFFFFFSFLHCSVVDLFIIKVRIRLNKLLMLLCSLMRRKCFWGIKTTTEV